MAAARQGKRCLEESSKVDENLPSKETWTPFLARCDREEDRRGLAEEGSTLEGGLLPGMRFMVERAGWSNALPGEWSA